MNKHAFVTKILGGIVISIKTNFDLNLDYDIDRGMKIVMQLIL